MFPFECDILESKTSPKAIPHARSSINSPFHSKKDKKSPLLPKMDDEKPHFSNSLWINLTKPMEQSSEEKD